HCRPGMIDRSRTFLAVLLALLIYPGDNLGGAFQPEFMKPLANLTISLGRDAVFTCHVEHLGGYRVGWVKADTKAIQAIHDHVITHNPRVSVSHGDHSTWSLRIKGAQKEDEGLYMCQINTNPMKFQTGMLKIKVPPDFIAEETSGDVTIQEGWHVILKCRATGEPPPVITWRREDLKDIIIHDTSSEKSTSSSDKSRGRISFPKWDGPELPLRHIKRDQMGVYHCLASNGVPPTISKRISVEVHFPPLIQVPNQLVGAPLGTNVTLVCHVEASPQSINFWRKQNPQNNAEHMIISTGRHEVSEGPPSKGETDSNFNFKVTMLLTIRYFTKDDVGVYKCIAKNSNGEHESTIRLYDIANVKGRSSPPIDPVNRNDDSSGNRVDLANVGSRSFEDFSGPRQRLPTDNDLETQQSLEHQGPQLLNEIETGKSGITSRRPSSVSRARASHADKNFIIVPMFLLMTLLPPKRLLSCR
ncbi:hypothetical protein QAD02_017078, partial [Eretmocerus hayati]